jgi:hypothetical protein
MDYTKKEQAILPVSVASRHKGDENSTADYQSAAGCHPAPQR